MFEKFTDRSRRVTVLAQEEARLAGHDYIGTEHILLALLTEAGSVAADALGRLGVTRDTAHAAVYAVTPPNPLADALPGHLPFTPACKETLTAANRESLQLGHNYIAPEHLLLALIRAQSKAALIMVDGLGLDLAVVRRTVIDILTDARPQPSIPEVELAEAQRVVDRHTCSVTGHDWVVLTTMAGEPTAIGCNRRCGHKQWKIVPADD